MRSAPGDGDGDPYLPGHGDETFDVESYELELDYRVASNHLDAGARLVVVARAPLDRLVLDLSGLRVRKVVVDGRRPAAYSARAGRLRVRLEHPAATGDRLEITIRYDGNPRPVRSHWGELGWEELSDGVIVAGQPGGAPSWFPCNDRPANKATYRTTVTAESEYTVVANGLLVDRRSGASRTTWVYDQRQPTATYLATVQIGRYERRELGDGDVPQHLFRPARLNALCEHDFGRRGQMLAVFSELFGPYPFGAYSVVVTDDELEIPLEAQGMSVFGANHVDGARSHERLVAHELAHQWFGNSLTAARWSDIWLHEGFACYAEWLWSERSGGQSADTHARRHRGLLAARPQDLVLVDPGPKHMFDDAVYKRGALTLHALRTTLGDDRFFGRLREWVSAHRYGTVTTEQFERHWGDDPAITRMLHAWLRVTELPALPEAMRRPGRC
ncbi:MAG: M1 family metallopeptidase [Actinomycetes bacterium]